MAAVDPDIYRSYTRALRHPVIVGRIAGWRLPWALSATQLGAVGATAGVLLATRGLWAHLGGIGNLAFFSAVLAAVVWAVRHWRIEGRSPVRVAAAITKVALSPGNRRGIRNGRPATSARPLRSSGATITTSHLRAQISGRDDG